MEIDFKFQRKSQEVVICLIRNGCNFLRNFKSISIELLYLIEFCLHLSETLKKIGGKSEIFFKKQYSFGELIILNDTKYI